MCYSGFLLQWMFNLCVWLNCPVLSSSWVKGHLVWQWHWGLVKTRLHSLLLPQSLRGREESLPEQTSQHQIFRGPHLLAWHQTYTVVRALPVTFAERSREGKRQPARFGGAVDSLHLLSWDSQPIRASVLLQNDDNHLLPTSGLDCCFSFTW